MAVVSRLCTKMEPQDDCLPSCVECLSSLLRNEDSHVADGALKCFASLADRFIRKNVDPEPLAEHGLTDELLKRLSNASAQSGPGLNTSTSNAGAASTAPEGVGKTAASVSTTISLLSTLCRGSGNLDLTFISLMA